MYRGYKKGLAASDDIMCKPCQSLNTETSMKVLVSVWLVDTFVAACRRYTVPKKYRVDSQLYSLDTVEVVIKLEEIFVLESMQSTNAPRKSLQQHNVSGRPVLQALQQVSAFLKTKRLH